MPKPARPLRVIELLAIAAIGGIAIALLLPCCGRVSDANISAQPPSATAP